jgi:KaiC/GvpD/RAD55 family RecA-like ATPase
MPYATWLDRWNLPSDPCKDIEINAPEHLKYLVTTSNTARIEAEVKDIRNSPVGVVKPVIGSRGSGKTTCLYYLIYSLEREQGTLPIYRNVHEVLSLIEESPFPVTLTTRFITRELLSSLVDACTRKYPELMKNHPVIEDVKRRLERSPGSPKDIPQVADSDVGVLTGILKGNGITTIFALDELDKFEQPSQIATLEDYFRNEQTLFTTLASKTRTFFYISSSVRWSFIGSPDFSYLSNTFQVQRTDWVEAKMILEKRFEVVNKEVKPPFDESAIRCLVSFVNGNPRVFITKAGEMLRLAHERDENLVNEELIRQAFSGQIKEIDKRFEDDFEELVRSNSEARRGGLLLWYFLTRLNVDQRKIVMNEILDLYHGNACDTRILPVPNRADVEMHALKEKDGVVGLDESVRYLLKSWEKMGHSVSDLANWYCERLPKPGGLPEAYQLIEKISTAVHHPKTRAYLQKSLTSLFTAESSKDLATIRYSSWGMLHNAILAFTNEYGRYRYVPLGKYRERYLDDALTALGIKDEEGQALFATFLQTANESRIKLANIGAMISIRHKHELVLNRGDVELLRKQALDAYNELLVEWASYVDKRRARTSGELGNRGWLPSKVSKIKPIDHVSTGYSDLDTLLYGGIPSHSAVILTSPSCNERDELIKSFLEAGANKGEATFFVTIDPSVAKSLAEEFQSNFCLFVCNPEADAIVKSLPNVFTLKGVENLTDISIALTSAVRKLDSSLRNPRRMCIGLVSDVLLQHHAVETRRWLTALVTKVKSEGFTTLAVMDPEMHPSQEVRAVSDLFEGEISIYEKETDRGHGKYLKIKKMSNYKYLEDELPLKKEPP